MISVLSTLLRRYLSRVVSESILFPASLLANLDEQSSLAASSQIMVHERLQMRGNLEYCI